MKQVPENMNFSTEKFSGFSDGGKEKKKKSKSKRFGSSVLPLVESSEVDTQKEEKTKPSSADKVLAELAFARDKREKQEAVEDSKQAEKTAEDTEAKIEKAEKVEKAVEAAEATDKAEDDEATSVEELDADTEVQDKLAETFSTDYNQEIKANELPPSKLFSEGVIDLGKPDEEIIALREEEPQPIAWTQQPEQQHFAQQDTPESQENDEPVTSESAAPDAPTAEVPPAARPAHEVEPPAAVPTSPAAQNASRSYSTLYNQPPVVSNPNVPPNPNQQPPAPNVPPLNPNVINPVAPNAVQNPSILQNPNVLPLNPLTNPNQVSAPTPNNKNQYVTKQQMEDEVYYATKYGQRRGVIAGAIAGGWWEHRKHKKREKRQEKEFAEQTKALEKEHESVAFQNKEQASLLNEKDRQLREMQTAAERQKQATPLTATETQRPSAAAEINRSQPEQRGEAKDFSTQLEKLIPKRPERAGKDKEVDESRLEIPEDHHLETSAWHTIEVDSKTGKAVENPTFAYGEEYYHERAKEMTPRTTNQKHAAGEVAIVAASIGEGSTQQAGDQSASGQDPSDASTQQRTSVRELVAAKAKDAYKAGKKAAKGSGSQQNSGPLWPWLVAFGVVVILLIAVL